MCACVGPARKRLEPITTDVPHKRKLIEAAESYHLVTPPTVRTGNTEVLKKWVEFYHSRNPTMSQPMRHVDDDGDPAIGTSPFDQDGDYGFASFDGYDQAATPPRRLLDRYGAPTLDAEEVFDDAQPSKSFVPTAPLAFHADDESDDGEDSDNGAASHAARALRKAEYSSDDDGGEEEADDAEFDFNEAGGDQSSSEEELNSDGSSGDDDDDDDNNEALGEAEPTAWSEGEEE